MEESTDLTPARRQALDLLADAINDVMLSKTIPFDAAAWALIYLAAEYYLYESANEAEACHLEAMPIGLVLNSLRAVYRNNPVKPKRQDNQRVSPFTMSLV